jgi:polysaccharide export outer membrane protein
MNREIALVLAAAMTAWGCAASTATTPHSGDTATRTEAEHTVPPGPEPGSSAPASKTTQEALARLQPAAPSAAAPAAGSSAVDEEYLLAPRDQVSVQVYGQDDLTRTVRLDQDGKIVLPLIGPISIGGMTTQAAEERIEGELTKGGYLKHPKVTVAVTEFQGRQYAVMGGVNQPGSYTLRSRQVSLATAISEARGVRDNAEQVAYVVRARPRADEPQPLRVDLAGLMQSGAGNSVAVEAGDVVYVPEDNTFYVTGEVEKRGAYTLRRDTTLWKAITEAGGVTKTAAKDRITLIRTMPDGAKKEIGGIDLDTISKGDRQADLRLQPQDVIVVPSDGGKVVGYGFLDFLRGIFSIGIPLVP